MIEISNEPRVEQNIPESPSEFFDRKFLEGHIFADKISRVNKSGFSFPGGRFIFIKVIMYEYELSCLFKTSSNFGDWFNTTTPANKFRYKRRINLCWFCVTQFVPNPIFTSKLNELYTFLQDALLYHDREYDMNANLVPFRKSLYGDIRYGKNRNYF